MSGRRGKKQGEALPPPKEKKRASPAEIWADDKATGQEGKVSAAVIRSSYGYSSMVNRRTKAQINEDFQKRNWLMRDNEEARQNQRVYQEYHDAHTLRQLARNKVFAKGKLVARGVAYSESKNRLEKVNMGSDRKPWPRSVQGEGSDYDMEGDENIKEVLAKLPPLPVSSSMTSQPPATGSGAGQQEPPPPPSKAGSASLG